jgi:hypothetical protein
MLNDLLNIFTFSPDIRTINIPSYSKIIDGKRYTTDGAKLLAGNKLWHNRWGLIFKTPNGNYFELVQFDSPEYDIHPYGSERIAMQRFEHAKQQLVSHEEAFPQVIIADA